MYSFFSLFVSKSAPVYFCLINLFRLIPADFMYLQMATKIPYIFTFSQRSHFQRTRDRDDIGSYLYAYTYPVHSTQLTYESKCIFISPAPYVRGVDLQCPSVSIGVHLPYSNRAHHSWSGGAFLLAEGGQPCSEGCLPHAQRQLC